jgi:hypothetical protein
MSLRIPLTLLFLFGFTHLTFSQRKKAEILTEDLPKGRGSVTLFDGSKVLGEVTFNDNDGIVTVKTGDDEAKSFTAKKIIAFEFLDDATFRNRSFLVIDYADPDTGQSGFSFFEVLGEFETFAIVSRIDRVKAEPDQPLLGPYTAPALKDRNNTLTVTSQTETIFFLNAQGDFQPYVKTVKREFERLLIDSKQDKNSFVNRDLLEEYTGEHYTALRDFIKENKLKLKIKEDLLLVIEEYKRLASN